MNNSELVGHYVKILPTTKLFVDGIGIPEWIRDATLYIERVNSNGTIVLAYDQTTMMAGCLFQRDVAVLDEVRTYHDTLNEEPTFTMRIMGVEKRIEHINFTKQRFNIPDDQVFLDTEHRGCVENAKRAWLAETDNDHVLVIQDDVEFCDDFIHYANLFVKLFPDDILTFFPFQFFSLPSKGIPKQSPYMLTTCLSGQATMMPTKYIKPCISAWREDIKGDDTNIMEWGKNNGIRFITTIPALTQHLGQVSVYDVGRSIGRSDCYRKNPVGNFECGYLNHWSNFVST